MMLIVNATKLVAFSSVALFQLQSVWEGLFVTTLYLHINIDDTFRTLGCSYDVALQYHFFSVESHKFPLFKVLECDDMARKESWKVN